MGRDRRAAWHLATCGHVSNQIVYLLSSSESRDRADEIENLRRLVTLLNRLEPGAEELNRAVSIIDMRRANPEDQPGRGLWIDTDDLQTLKENLLRSSK